MFSFETNFLITINLMPLFMYLKTNTFLVQPVFGWIFLQSQLSFLRK